jgi:hypothetical protein
MGIHRHDAAAFGLLQVDCRFEQIDELTAQTRTIQDEHKGRRLDAKGERIVVGDGDFSGGPSFYRFQYGWSMHIFTPDQDAFRRRHEKNGKDYESAEEWQAHQEA